MLSWKEQKAVFWLNATFKIASQWMENTSLHQWARRKLKESTQNLIPLAITAFKEAHPDIASDPHVRYTFYPGIDTGTGYVDVMCVGEVGFSLTGAMAHINVGLGLTDCVFHANANGELV